MPKFKLEGHDPIEIRVHKDGQLIFMDGRVLVRLTDGRLMLTVNLTDEHPLEQSSETAVVSVNLGRQKATGVKVDVDTPVNIESGHTLVNLTRSVWRVLLTDGTYFVLPVSGTTRLPSPVEGVIFVAEKAVAERAIEKGRSDVVSPVLDLNSTSGPICNEGGEPVLIRALA